MLLAMSTLDLNNHLYKMLFQHWTTLLLDFRLRTHQHEYFPNILQDPVENPRLGPYYVFLSLVEKNSLLAKAKYADAMSGGLVVLHYHSMLQCHHKYRDALHPHPEHAL